MLISEIRDAVLKCCWAFQNMDIRNAGYRFKNGAKFQKSIGVYAPIFLNVKS